MIISIFPFGEEFREESYYLSSNDYLSTAWFYDYCPSLIIYLLASLLASPLGSEEMINIYLPFGK